MTGQQDSRRGTRSHGGSSSRPRSGSSTTRTRSRQAPSGRRPAERRTSGRTSDHADERGTRDTARTRTATRRPPARRRPPQSDLQKFASALWASFWHSLGVAFSGEVPPEYKYAKVPSAEVHQRVKKRLRLSLLLFLPFLVIIMGRIVMVETVSRAGYLAVSIEQRTRTNTVRAARGVIFDRNGSELALSVPSTTVYADPRDIVDKPAAAHAIATVLGYDATKEAALAAKMSEPGSKFLYLSRELTKDQAAPLLALGIKGIYSYTEPSRQVEGGVAQAIIGKTDPDGVGTSGLELQFDKLLTGVDGRVVREVDRKGNSIAGGGRTTTTPVPGDDLVLTVDKNIQYHAEAALLDRVGQLQAKGGTAIVMDSRTGEVYAMANVRRDATTGAAFLTTGNYGAVEAYEPGSVAKVFSLSAAINEAAVAPETTIKVPGVVTIDKFPIRDAWPHGTIDMSVRDILVESSNIGTMLAAQRIPTTKLHDYYKAFGFGEKTGLDYPGESRGILRDAGKWRGTEKVTVSYGYGFAATALQLVAGVNTVANGGTYVAPKIVAATIDKSGTRKEAPASATHRVLSPATAATMTDMMRDVVCRGTATLAQVKGMHIAGKTGTGYKVQKGGTYEVLGGGRRYFASFAGFFPAEAPRVTILVSIDEPDAMSRDRFGGTAAAPVFARLVPTVMQELGIQATGTGTGCKAGDKPAGH